MAKLSFVLFLVCASAGAAHAQSPTVRALDAFPIAFERNAGQADPQARYIARGGGYTLLLTDEGTILRLPGHRDIRVTLTGARPGAVVAGEAALPGTVNYFIGRDPSQWRTDIPTYARARYTQVYPGIDLVYYGAKGRLDNDFVVAPGSDPGSIRMRFDGVDRLALEDDGDLALRVGDETLTIEKPTLYQEVGDERQPVAGRFRLLPGGEVGFDVGEHDDARSLVIDPVLVYSTVVEASSSSAHVQDLVVDGAGAVYVMGFTGGQVFVAKLNPTGTALLFETYLGSLANDTPAAIGLDETGNIYVAGSTTSWDFPIVSAAQPALAGPSDAFVAKLAPGGNDLLYSTFLGGSSQETAAAMAVDTSGNAYVVGVTQSADFPLVSPVQATRPGGLDGFLTKFDSLGNRVLSTYFGASGDDSPRAVALSVADTLVIAGQTSSISFPVAIDATQPSLSGATDGFVARVRALDFSIVHATYLGGSGFDTISDVVVDATGATYLVGSTASTDFPTTAGVVQPVDPSGSDDGFLAKFSPDSLASIYSTYLRGPAVRAAVDGTGHPVVTGTASSGVPLVNPLQSQPFSSSDSTIFKLTPDGTSYLFSTYWAGEFPMVALDSTGDIYVAGSTSLESFPTTPGALQATSAGFTLQYAYVAKINLLTPPCSFQVRPDSLVVGTSVSFNHAITVIAPGGCNWTATTDSNWIELATASGAGVGTVPYRVQSTAIATRSGTITIADKVVPVVQPWGFCSYAVSPVTTQPSSGGEVMASITAGAGCPWAVVPRDSWVSVTDSSGVGNGVITLQLQPNLSIVPRSTTVRVARTQDASGTMLSITQAGTCDTALTASGTSNVPRAGGMGMVTATVSPPSCAWNVMSSAPWLTYSPSGGTGNGTVTFTVAPNSTTGARVGQMLIAGGGLIVNQAGPPTVAGPSVLPPSPSAGSGATQTFTFTFYDTIGPSNLDVVNILINNFLDGRFGCYLAYSRPINVLYLVNDLGNALLPGLVLDGSAQTLGNSRCAIDGSASSAVASGKVLTLTLKITFDSLFAGNKVIYQAARSFNGIVTNTGWVQQGVWHVPGGAPGSPAVMSMTPGRGGGRDPYPIQFTYRDADGYADLVSTTVLLNSYLDGGGACYLGYHVPSNAVLLLNDPGNAYLPWLPLGATGTVENSQCRIYSTGSGAVGSGTDLTLTLVIEFKSGFAGERVFYLSAQDGVATSGWQSMGSWTVP